MVFQEKWYPWFQGKKKKKKKHHFVKRPEAQGSWSDGDSIKAPGPPGGGAGGSFKTGPQIPAAP